MARWIVLANGDFGFRSWNIDNEVVDAGSITYASRTVETLKPIHPSKRWRKGMPELITFSSRREAERFAAARSYWRGCEAFMLVCKVGESRWTSCYRGGRLNDTQDRRSYDPREELPQAVVFAGER